MPASEHSNIWKTTVYSVLLILAIWPLCHGRQVYHVTPNEETHCHNATVSCHTLDYYAKELHSDPFYFRQQTVLYFHPGIHNLAGNISIATIAELVLLGSDTMSSSSMVPFESTEILCTSEGGAGFIFLRVNNLVIVNLTLTSCGIMYRNTSAAFRIESVTYLTISHIVIQNSTGYGVAAVIDEPGNIEITNSTFIYTGRDTDQKGGNVIFRNSLANCSAGGNGSGVYMSVRSSRFLYRNTLGRNSPGVYLFLEYPCYPFQIHINNSIFIYSNRENRKKILIGGHLFLYFVYSSLSKVHGSTIMITNCQFINGTGQFSAGGAGIHIQEEVSAHPCNECAFPSQIHLAVFNTLFHGNNAGGLLVITNQQACHGHLTLELNNVTFTNNSGNGGNTPAAAHVTIVEIVTALYPHAIKIRNCTFANGEATKGTSLLIDVEQVDWSGKETCINTYNASTSTCVEISDLMFTNNKCELGGVIIMMERYATNFPCRIDICNSSFTSDIAPALSVILGNSISGAEVYMFRFTNLNFNNNYSPLAQSPYYTNVSIQDRYSMFRILYANPFLNNIGDTAGSSSSVRSVILLSNVKSATFHNCEVSESKGAGLSAENSMLLFEGSSTFRGNLGIFGGGMLLVESYILLNSKVQLYFINNHARFGGAICVFTEPSGNCFFQPNSHNSS